MLVWISYLDWETDGRVEGRGGISTVGFFLVDCSLNRRNFFSMLELVGVFGRAALQQLQRRLQHFGAGQSTPSRSH